MPESCRGPTADSEHESRQKFNTCGWARHEYIRYTPVVASLPGNRPVQTRTTERFGHQIPNCQGMKLEPNLVISGRPVPRSPQSPASLRPPAILQPTNGPLCPPHPPESPSA